MCTHSCVASNSTGLQAEQATTQSHPPVHYADILLKPGWTQQHFLPYTCDSFIKLLCKHPWFRDCVSGLTWPPSCWPHRGAGCSPPCPWWWHTGRCCCQSPGRWRFLQRLRHAPAAWLPPPFGTKHYRKSHSLVLDNYTLQTIVCCERVTHLHIRFVAVFKYSHGGQGARTFRKDQLDQYSTVLLKLDILEWLRVCQLWSG